MDVDPGEGLHYLDNAATTWPKPREVVDAVARFLAEGVSPGRATYDLAVHADHTLSACRRKVAALLGCRDPDRVVFGANATDALNLVIFGYLGRGGHVVSTRLEHNSVQRPIQHCVDDAGARATLVPFDGAGYVDPDDVRRALEPDTRLVVVNHASNVLGTVQPVAEIGAICREAGVPFCVDAAQSAGAIPVDMAAMNVDLLAFTGHKSLLGPMGVGGLCVGDGVEVPQTRAGGRGVRSAERRHLTGYPYRLEAGTPNMPGILGLAAGIDVIEARGGVDRVHAETMERAAVLWQALRETDGVTPYGPETLSAEARTAVLAFNFDGLDPAQAGARLDVDHDVACRTGLHCAPLVHETLGTAPGGSLRVSVGPTTTRADAEAGARAIRALAAEIAH